MNKLLFFLGLNCLLQGLQIQAAAPAGTTAPSKFKATLTMRGMPQIEERNVVKVFQTTKDLPLQSYFKAQAEPNSKEPFDRSKLQNFIKDQAMVVAKKDFSLRMNPNLGNDVTVKERFNSSQQARILYDRVMQQFNILTKADIELVQLEIQKALDQQRMIEQQRQQVSLPDAESYFETDLDNEVQDFIKIHEQDKVKQPVDQLRKALRKELKLVKRLANFDQRDVNRWISERVHTAKPALVKIAAPTQEALADAFKKNVILKIQSFIKSHEKDVIKQPLSSLQEALDKELDFLKQQTQLEEKIASQIKQEQMPQAHPHLVKMALPTQEAIDLSNRLKSEAVTFVTQNSSNINFNERLNDDLQSAVARAGIPLENIDVPPLVIQAMNVVLNAFGFLQNSAAEFSYQESLHNKSADIQRLRDYLKEKSAAVEIQLPDAELHRLIEDIIKEQKEFMLPGTPEDTQQEEPEDENVNQE